MLLQEHSMIQSELKGRVHSVESLGTVDGPGIRFVIFMQGCPMRCLYCHNPDTWTINSGMELTVAEIMEKYEDCREFLKNGGITVTGGEPLLQLEFVTELFEEAKRRGIHTCLDTSGITFSREKEPRFKRLLKVTDLIMLDIKHIRDEEHRKLTGHSNKNILAFAHFADSMGVEIWIRHVIVPGITFIEEYLRELGRFMATIDNVNALDVLPYHDMGKEKYKKLGIDYPLVDVKPMTKDDAAAAKNLILQEFYLSRNEK